MFKDSLRDCRGTLVDFAGILPVAIRLIVEISEAIWFCTFEILSITTLTLKGSGNNLTFLLIDVRKSTKVAYTGSTNVFINTDEFETYLAAKIRVLKTNDNANAFNLLVILAKNVFSFVKVISVDFLIPNELVGKIPCIDDMLSIPMYSPFKLLALTLRRLLELLLLIPLLKPLALPEPLLTKPILFCNVENASAAFAKLHYK